MRCFTPTFSAPRTATERERRSELEVVNIAYTALRRRSIDKYSAGLHCIIELLEFVFTSYRIEIDRRSVSVTAVCDEYLSLCESVVEILSLVHSEYRRELLVSERFARLDGLYLSYENLSIRGNFYTCKLGYLRRGLSYDSGIDRAAVAKYYLTNGVDLASGKDMSVTRLEFFLNLFVYLSVNDYRLLRSAYHTVVESLGVDNGIDRNLNVARLVHDSGRISGSYAESRLT